MISSPDRLSWDLGISSQQDACNDVKISYDLNLEEAPPEELFDPRLVAALREAVDLSAPCLPDGQVKSETLFIRCPSETGDFIAGYVSGAFGGGGYNLDINQPKL